MPRLMAEPWALPVCRVADNRHVAAPPRDYLEAARRYGPSVDAIAARYTNPLTGRRLSGTALLLKLGSGESGFQSDAESNVGAQGRTQFMPGSRAIAMQRFGIDPLKDADSAVHAAALHLRGKINGSTGLEGYNPGGGQGYVSYILGQRVGSGGGGPRASARGSSSTPGTSAAGPQSDGGGQQLAALLSAAVGAQQPRQSMGLQAPAFAAAPVLPQGAQPVMSQTPPRESPGAALSQALTAIKGLVGPDAPATPESPGDAVPGAAGGAVSGRAIKPGGGYEGTQGVARSLASFGLDLGLEAVSEKRHNTNPYSGSRSDHDLGNKDAYAYDLSNGKAPTPEMDRAALRVMRRLGFKDYQMGEAIDTGSGVKTIQTKQGRFRVQVIYRGSGAAFGGNHLGHLHIGVKRVG